MKADEAERPRAPVAPGERAEAAAEAGAGSARPRARVHLMRALTIAVGLSAAALLSVWVGGLGVLTQNEATARAPASAPTPGHSGDRRALAPREAFAEIDARPLFTSTRRPPPGAPSEPTSAGAPRAKLVAVLGEAGQRVSILETADRRQVRLREGERLEGWRIEAIEVDAIRLSRNGESHTITIAEPGSAAPRR